MISRFEQFSGAVACIYRCIQKIERVEMAKYGLKATNIVAAAKKAIARKK